MAFLSLLRDLRSRTILRNIIFILLVIVAVRYSGLAQGGGAGGGWQQNYMYLFYGYCQEADDINQCLSYDTDAEAYAAREGMCVDDQMNMGPSPWLWMHAYGSCLPTASVWNEAHVSGGFRDPGLDGYATNTLIFTGTEIGRWWGASHCDGYIQVWNQSNSGCP